MTDSDAEDYEDVTTYTLDADVEERLLLAHNECTFIWSNKEGWPVGVIMSYVWRKGRFWLTASRQRARVAAVRRDPRVCVVVTSTGSPMPRNKAITWKGTCTVHDGREVKDWFYPELATALSRRAGAGGDVPGDSSTRPAASSSRSSRPSASATTGPRCGSRRPPGWRE